MSIFNLEVLTAQAWAQAAHQPVFNAICCQTGGLTLDQWRAVAAQARALTAPKAKA